MGVCRWSCWTRPGRTRAKACGIRVGAAHPASPGRTALEREIAAVERREACGLRSGRARHAVCLRISRKRDMRWRDPRLAPCGAPRPRRAFNRGEIADRHDPRKSAETRTHALRNTMNDRHDDPDTIPPDILRVMQNLNQSWRRCRRKSCRRSRSCRSADVRCAVEQVTVKPRRNPEKAARDDARAMAIFQRMLRERLDELGGENQGAPQQAIPPRRRRSD
jgi:hypothetical protein